jgi:hypothetical protein
MYTAVPQAATRAPTSHMIKDTPTLPDKRRILLGVAYILLQNQVVLAADSMGSRQRTPFLPPD